MTSLITLPKSAADFNPPKPSDLHAQSADLIRKYYDELKPDLDALAGLVESDHGDPEIIETLLGIKAKELAKHNGYTAVAQATTKVVIKSLRVALKRNTSIRMADLKEQGKRLMLEYAQSKATVEAAANGQDLGDDVGV
jgi:hypothetical protein